jgi:methoxymalonate biosynthesis acyl carrier protein
VATEIQGWLRDNLTADREIPLDKQLIENGVLTSLQTVELVTFLEERFGIIVEDEEFDEENFGSVEAIAGLVASQKTAAGTANSGCVFTTCRATPWSARGSGRHL